MFAISEVHNVNVWSQTATWKSTLFSEQCLTGALGGISGVSQSPSIPDTCNCLKYIATRRWSQSFSVMSANRYLTLVKCSLPMLPDVRIYNEQYISDVVFTRAGLATSPLMDGLDSLFHIEELHRNSCIQKLQLLSVLYEFIFFLQ